MITSTNNQQLKAVSALLKKSKERKEKKAFVVEGPRMVVEAPAEELKAVYVAESFEKNPEHKASWSHNIIYHLIFLLNI